MKKRTDHLGLGFVLIVLTGSLWAQVPDPEFRAPQLRLQNRTSKATRR